MRKYFKKYCGWYACFTLTALYSFVQMLILQIEFIPFFTQMIPVLHYIHHGVIFSFSGRVVIQTNDFHRAHSLKRTHKWDLQPVKTYLNWLAEEVSSVFQVPHFQKRLGNNNNNNNSRRLYYCYYYQHRLIQLWFRSPAEPLYCHGSRWGLLLCYTWNGNVTSDLHNGGQNSPGWRILFYGSS